MVQNLPKPRLNWSPSMQKYLKLRQRDCYFEKLNTGFKGTFFGITGNDKVLLAYGLQGVIYKSTDQGVFWNALDTPTQVTISKGFPVSSDEDLFIAQNGDLLFYDLAADNISVSQINLPMSATAATITPSGVVFTGFQGIVQQPFSAIIK
jgi:hypothetical protein